MFAILVLEREPLRLDQLPAAFQIWQIAAGGFALFALLLGLLVYAFSAGWTKKGATPWMTWLLTSFVGGALLALIPTLLFFIFAKLGWGEPLKTTADNNWGMHFRLLPLSYVGSCALVAVLFPVLFSFARLRWRRVWALAKLCFQEAVRKKILWAFSCFLLVFLFASWFFPYDYKPENQVRNYVRLVYWAMSPILLLVAGWLAAFSIPADIKNQTIHTIVTKPVERLEIILGRFLGFTLLMTLVLVVMTGLSLIYVSRGVDEDAREESLKARVPIFGDLLVKGGKSVGREWEYRSYISGGVTEEQAVWDFTRVPSSFAERPSVRCEFAFDIFRTTKGVENKGVYCSFAFENWQWQPSRENEYRKELDEERSKANPGSELEIANRLAEKFGFYEIPSKEIDDYHTLFVDVPGGLFRKLADWKPGNGVPFKCSVRCESKTQYLGVAKPDLYLLDSEGMFQTNFFKGAAGLWLRLCLVIGVAVTCSTYLSGIIAFLATMFLYGVGCFQEFIRDIASGKTIGGGPVEAFIRLARQENLVKQLDQGPSVSVALTIDKAFSWTLSHVLSAIPDVDRYDLTNYVAQGFNISNGQLLVDNILPLVGYLLPWGLLAFYLIKSREIAS